MNAAPFAARESRLTAGILRHLPNVMLYIDGAAAPVAAIFDDGYESRAVGVIGMGGAQPVARVATCDVPMGSIGRNVYLRDVCYRIADAQDDGLGMTALVLELP